ncbi:tetratricopeptide repeat protein [Bacillus thuringiensis]|nr:tetratricopeptide repeat protein [Bacillus thuringiensis]
MNVQLGNEQITKLLNDWYQEIRAQHIIKAKQLKQKIEKEINNIEEDQNLLLYYSLIDLRYKILTNDYADREQSLEKIEQLKEHTNNFLDYYYHFFKVMHAMKTGNYSETQKYYDIAEKLLEEIPDEVEKAEFNYAVATFYYHTHQALLATQYANKAKSFFSGKLGYEIKTGACENTLGMACITLREFSVAEEYLLSAINKFEKHSENKLALIVRYNLGLLYADQNLSELAIRYLLESFENQEDDYKTMFLLAQEYYKLKQTNTVNTYIEKGLNVCNQEYKIHFLFLQALNNKLSTEQLEKVMLDAIPYFEKQNLWKYIQDYTEELAIRFYEEKNKDKSNEYFYKSYKAKRNLLERESLK